MIIFKRKHIWGWISNQSRLLLLVNKFTRLTATSKVDGEKEQEQLAAPKFQGHVHIWDTIALRF